MENKLTFEAAMAQLDEILQTLSGPDVPLDESLSLYARAAELIGICNEQLEKAQIRIDEIGKTLPGGEDDG